MNEYDSSTGYSVITVVLDASDHYNRCEPKLRQMCAIWLNGYDEVYSLALRAYSVNYVNGPEASEKCLRENLYQIFNSEWTKIEHCYKCISSIIAALQVQFTGILMRLNATPLQIKLASVEEVVTNEWECGTIFLKIGYPVWSEGTANVYPYQNGTPVRV